MRRLLLLGVGALLFVGAAAALLLRDPSPRFAERRSALAEVVQGPAERSEGLVSQPLHLTAASGLSFDLLVRTPEDVIDGSGRRPLFLILGGYRTGAQAAMLVDDTRGAVVAAMGYPYDGPVDVKGLAVLRYLPEIRGALLDTPPAVQLALDHLLSLPQVDPERVELLGVSFGAFLAPAAAALDTRVTRLWLVHGAGQPYRVLEHGLERYVPYTLPRKVVAGLAHLAFAGPQLAPEDWLPRVSPRPVVIINASDDERLPREAVEALYASARPPKEQIWLSGEHVHPDRPEVIEEVMDVVLSRASRDRPHRLP